MAYDLPRLSALLDHGFDTVIDVRSPAEYAEDHLPGAISLPALSDEERARVGTIYKQDSPFRARKIGAALVARNVAAHLDGPLADKDGGWRPLVYCWRGGQRSGSVATILREIGWRVEVLTGGYRAFRREVVASLYDRPLAHRLVVLDGNTGTAKTALLARLAGRGVQVLDLEGMANHRGSVLGPRAGGQPGQKAFETALATGLAACDPGRPVVVEAESSKIGAAILPPEVWKAMAQAPRIEVEAPVAARAAYLARAYADLTADTEELVGRLRLLIPLQGRERVAQWTALAQAGAHEALAADLIEAHYDPRYEKSRARFADLRVATVSAASLDEAALDALADEVAATLGAIAP
ncbi:tRNA 2-selenouridine(34) synthase MnmH [Palleronia sp. KMU-117]|uniref:tRNA 2-selenouridine(34) synthase MnmH n=1 Tax=Palleronia sp. KMU-117 TaxID=3434108 RepID=UPI003D723B01